MDSNVILPDMEFEGSCYCFVGSERGDIRMERRLRDETTYVDCSNDFANFLLTNYTNNDINIYDSKNDFLFGCSIGCIQLIQLMLSLDIFYGKGILYACCNNHKDIVELLISNSKCDLTVVNNNRKVSALMYACMNPNAIDIVKLLLKKYDGNINQVDNDHISAFTYACMNGCIDAVNILMNEYNCNVNDVGGMDCANGFMYACMYGHEEIVELLLKKNNCDIHHLGDEDRNSFIIACSEGHLKVVELLVKKSNINIHQLECNGQNAFSMACWEKDNKEILEFLVKETNININQINDNGQNGFMFACMQDNVDLVKFMLTEYTDYLRHNNDYNFNLSVDMQDNNGDTAIMLAAKRGNREVVNVLISYNCCNLHLENKKGLTAALIACNYPDIVFLIENQIRLNRNWECRKFFIMVLNENKYLQNNSMHITSDVSLTSYDKVFYDQNIITQILSYM